MTKYKNNEDDMHHLGIVSEDGSHNTATVYDAIQIKPKSVIRKSFLPFSNGGQQKIGSILFNSCHRLGQSLSILCAYNAKVMETIINSSKKDSKDTLQSIT